MRRFQPLPTTDPQFTILDYPSFREYRVENWHLARDGSGRLVKGTSLWSWWETVASALLSFIWTKVRGNVLASNGLALLCIFLVWTKCTQVLFESVVVIPPHGIQLETHRGLPSLPLAASRRFIPTSVLQDFVINEGLRGWDVRYYLVAIKKSGPNDFILDVAYENILPHSPVLVEVYRGVQEMLTATSNKQSHLTPT